MTDESNSAANSDSPPSEVRLFTASGRYAIIAIAALAIGGAVFNWLYQRELHRRSLELWGPEISRLIVQAPQVEALRLAKGDSVAVDSADARAEAIKIDGQKWSVVERRQIDTPTQAPGSSHVRRSLVNDRSFDWDARFDDCQPNWQFALRFREGPETQTIVLDLDCPRAALVGSEARASIGPVVAPLKEFFSEVFPRHGSGS